jgi:hypothetical protein
VLRYDVVGPSQDGTADNSVEVKVSGVYDKFIVSAFVGHSAAPQSEPPKDCGGGGETVLGAACSQLTP